MKKFLKITTIMQIVFLLSILKTNAQNDPHYLPVANPIYKDANGELCDRDADGATRAQYSVEVLTNPSLAAMNCSSDKLRARHALKIYDTFKGLGILKKWRNTTVESLLASMDDIYAITHSDPISFKEGSVLMDRYNTATDALEVWTKGRSSRDGEEGFYFNTSDMDDPSTTDDDLDRNYKIYYGSADCLNPFEVTHFPEVESEPTPPSTNKDRLPQEQFIGDTLATAGGATAINNTNVIIEAGSSGASYVPQENYGYSGGYQSTGGYQTSTGSYATMATGYSGGYSGGYQSSGCNTCFNPFDPLGLLPNFLCHHNNSAPPQPSLASNYYFNQTTQTWEYVDNSIVDNSDNHTEIHNHYHYHYGDSIHNPVDTSHTNDGGPIDPPGKRKNPNDEFASRGIKNAEKELADNKRNVDIQKSIRSNSLAETSPRENVEKPSRSVETVPKKDVRPVSLDPAATLASVNPRTVSPIGGGVKTPTNLDNGRPNPVLPKPVVTTPRTVTPLDNGAPNTVRPNVESPRGNHPVTDLGGGAVASNDRPKVNPRMDEPVKPTRDLITKRGREVKADEFIRPKNTEPQNSSSVTVSANPRNNNQQSQNDQPRQYENTPKPDVRGQQMTEPRKNVESPRNGNTYEKPRQQENAKPQPRVEQPKQRTDYQNQPKKQPEVNRPQPKQQKQEPRINTPKQKVAPRIQPQRSDLAVNNRGGGNNGRKN